MISPNNQTLRNMYESKEKLLKPEKGPGKNSGSPMDGL